VVEQGGPGIPLVGQAGARAGSNHQGRSSYGSPGLPSRGSEPDRNTDETAVVSTNAIVSLQSPSWKSGHGERLRFELPPRPTPSPGRNLFYIRAAFSFGYAGPRTGIAAKVAAWATTTAVCADAWLLARGTGLGLTRRTRRVGSRGKSIGERTHVVGGNKRGSGARGPQGGWSPLHFVRPLSRNVERSSQSHIDLQSDCRSGG
jgi:hypothetical protein